MPLVAFLPRIFGLALLSVAALLVALYAPAERVVYALGVPTGVAATAVLGALLAAGLAGIVLSWRHVLSGTRPSAA